MKFKVLFAVIGLSLVGCVEHVPKVKSNPVNLSKEDSNFIKKKDYKGFRLFSGVIPCEDCDQIEQRLVIKGDTIGVYRLTEVYKNATEDGDAVLVSTGEWITDKKSGDIHLSEHALKDSIRTMDYHVMKKELILFKADNAKILNSKNYHLKLVKAAI